MAHDHKLIDPDDIFVIDVATHEITLLDKEGYAIEDPIVVVQGDHNSERFTFEIPRIIESHDMSLCDKVEVHYINIGRNGEQSPGIYEVPAEDLSVDEDNEAVLCSWLISDVATRYEGSLNFAVKYSCTKDGNLEYAWNTVPYTNIIVSASINNAGVIVERYADLLQSWYQQFIIAGENSKEAVRDYAENTIKPDLATYATEQKSVMVQGAAEAMREAVLTEFDGRVTALENKNVIQIVTVNGKTIKFFVGPTSEYNELTEEEQQELVAFITDDTSKADLQAVISRVQGLIDGTETVRKAKCDGDGRLFGETYIQKNAAVITGNDLVFKSTNPTTTCGAAIRKGISIDGNGDHGNCGVNFLSIGDVNDPNSERASIKLFHSEKQHAKHRVQIGLSTTPEGGERYVDWFPIYGGHYFPAATPTTMGGVKSGGDITVAYDGAVAVNKITPSASSIVTYTIPVGDRDVRLSTPLSPGLYIVSIDTGHTNAFTIIEAPSVGTSTVQTHAYMGRLGVQYTVRSDNTAIVELTILGQPSPNIFRYDPGVATSTTKITFIPFGNLP